MKQRKAQECSNEISERNSSELASTAHTEVISRGDCKCGLAQVQRRGSEATNEDQEVSEKSKGVRYMPEKKRVIQSIEQYRNAYLQRSPFTTTNWLRERKRSKEIHKNMKFGKPQYERHASIPKTSDNSFIGNPSWKDTNKNKWITQEGFFNASNSFAGKQTRQAWEAGNSTEIHYRYEGGFHETGNRHLRARERQKEISPERYDNSTQPDVLGRSMMRSFSLRTFQSNLSRLRAAIDAVNNSIIEERRKVEEQKKEKEAPQTRPTSPPVEHQESRVNLVDLPEMNRDIEPEEQKATKPETKTPSEYADVQLAPLQVYLNMKDPKLYKKSIQNFCYKNNLRLKDQKPNKRPVGREMPGTSIFSTRKISLTEGDFARNSVIGDEKPMNEIRVLLRSRQGSRVQTAGPKQKKSHFQSTNSQR